MCDGVCLSVCTYHSSFLRVWEVAVAGESAGSVGLAGVGMLRTLWRKTGREGLFRSHCFRMNY